MFCRLGLGPIFYRFGGVLGGLGSIFGRFGGSWGAFGGSWEGSWRLLGGLGRLLGRLGSAWAVLSENNALVSASGAVSVLIWVPKGGQDGAQMGPKSDPRRTKIEDKNEVEKRSS